MSAQRYFLIALIVFVLAAPRAAAQSAYSPSPLDAVGSLVKDGHLTVEIDMRAGRVPVDPKWSVEVDGSPTTRVSADARDGKVEKLKARVDGGRLIVRGKGLRPKVEIQSLEFESPGGITGLEFHGLGIWRPLVAIFGGIGRSAARKLQLRTDIPSVLRGEILGPKSAASSPPSAPSSAPASPSLPSSTASPEPAAGSTFLDLVREVRINELTLTAFEGRRLMMEPFLSFQTAASPEASKAMRLSIVKGVFRPAHGGTETFYEFDGRLDGEFENGTLVFGEKADHAAFSRGRIAGGSFHVRSSTAGAQTEVAASRLAVDLNSGDLEVGGMRVAVAEGSRFAVEGVRVKPDGLFSGSLDLDLMGHTGTLERGGSKISASNVSVRASGLKIVDNRATGPVEMQFDYRLDYPFVVKYPIKEIPEKRLPLVFAGPFAATLQLTDAGASSGEVRGDYNFKAPWPPIEQAVLEVTRAKWKQDLAIKNVEFTLDPTEFRPCGGSCFEFGFHFTAEKRQQKKSLFHQYCEPLGRADLVLDSANRAFVLHDVKVETHCRGVVGWVVNFIAPLLAKTYSDTVLFQMPTDVPLSVDRIEAGVEWIRIVGRFDWKAARPVTAASR